MSLATVAVIGNGDFAGPINGLSFSRADGGVLLAAIEDSPDKIISVWEVRGDRGQRITETRVRFCSVDLFLIFLKLFSFFFWSNSVFGRHSCLCGISSARS